MKNKTKNLFLGILLSTCLLVCGCTTSTPHPFEQANFSVDLGYGAKMDFVNIPGGTFTRFRAGKFNVELSPFALGKTEVTQAQWLVVMGYTPEFLSAHPGFGIGENFPVYGISWEEAMQFCQKLTEREHAAGRLPKNLKFTLPTVTQWEYACRAGTETRYSFGNDLSLFPQYANFPDKSAHDYNRFMSYEERIMKYDDGFACVAPVGSFRPNAWGLYDMHGNVSEWCLDYSNPKAVPIIPCGKDPIQTTPSPEDERFVCGENFWCIPFIDVGGFFVYGASSHKGFNGFRVALIQSTNP